MKKQDHENGGIYSPVLTVSAGTSEFSTFTLGLPVRALPVLMKDAQPSWGVRCTS
jgi:hypothetical protein